MVHSPSVTYPNPPPCFAGEGGVTCKDPLQVFTRRLHLPLPAPLQRHPDCLSQPVHPHLAPPRSPPRGDSLFDKNPCLLQYPRVVALRPFVWIWHSAPQIGKYIVCPCPRLKYWKFDQKARPLPEVAQVIPWGGTAQSLHDHKMVTICIYKYSHEKCLVMVTLLGVRYSYNLTINLRRKAILSIEPKKVYTPIGGSLINFFVNNRLSLWLTYLVVVHQ